MSDKRPEKQGKIFIAKTIKCKYNKSNQFLPGR